MSLIFSWLYYFHGSTIFMTVLVYDIVSFTTITLSLEWRIQSTPTSSIRVATINILDIPVCQLHSCSSILPVQFGSCYSTGQLQGAALLEWKGREGGHFVQRLHCTCPVYMSKIMTGKGRRVLCYQVFDTRLTQEVTQFAVVSPHISYTTCGFATLDNCGKFLWARSILLAKISSSLFAIRSAEFLAQPVLFFSSYDLNQYNIDTTYLLVLPTSVWLSISRINWINWLNFLCAPTFIVDSKAEQTVRLLWVMCFKWLIKRHERDKRKKVFEYFSFSGHIISFRFVTRGIYHRMNIPFHRG